MADKTVLTFPDIVKGIELTPENLRALSDYIRNSRVEYNNYVTAASKLNDRLEKFEKNVSLLDRLSDRWNDPSGDREALKTNNLQSAGKKHHIDTAEWHLQNMENQILRQQLETRLWDLARQRADALNKELGQEGRISPEQVVEKLGPTLSWDSDVTGANPLARTEATLQELGMSPEDIESFKRQELLNILGGDYFNQRVEPTRYDPNTGMAIIPAQRVEVAPVVEQPVVEQPTELSGGLLQRLQGNGWAEPSYGLRTGETTHAQNRLSMAGTAYATALADMQSRLDEQASKGLVYNKPIIGGVTESSAGGGSQTGAKTSAPVKTPPAGVHNNPIALGTSRAYIPSTGYTEYNNAGGAPITVNPVDLRGDNGGGTWAAMNALYRDPAQPPSLGELIAFSSVMNGKSNFGGLADVHQTMEKADKMNAYASQAAIANRVQQLMQQGRTMEEARYEALSEHMLKNGMSRGAVSVTMPEYAKQADARAQREIDATAAAGGSYTGKGAFGYTPLGVRSLTTDKDAQTFDIDINGNVTTNTPLEYLGGTVTGLIKGDGSGATKASSTYLDALEFMDKKDMESIKQELYTKSYAAQVKSGVDPETAKKNATEVADFYAQYWKNYYSEKGKGVARMEIENAKQQVGNATPGSILRNDPAF